MVKNVVPQDSLFSVEFMLYCPVKLKCPNKEASACLLEPKSPVSTNTSRSSKTAGKVPRSTSRLSQRLAGSIKCTPRGKWRPWFAPWRGFLNRPSLSFPAEATLVQNPQGSAPLSFSSGCGKSWEFQRSSKGFFLRVSSPSMGAGAFPDRPPSADGE